MTDITQNNHLPHLLELRSRLLRCVLILLLFFAIFIYYSSNLYTHIATPLLNHLPHNGQLIATKLTATFTAPLKLSFYLAIFAAMPFILFQLWQFIGPGLQPTEQRFAWPLLLSCIGLFYLGISFAYFIVLPLLYQFFIHIAPTGVTVMPDIQHYLDLILKLTLAFGLAFEVPVIVFTLVMLNIVDAQSLNKARPYVIVSAFILGMVLTPPDILSQISLALPIYGLFELGLLLAKLMRK